ncbi:hypothetical protein [Pseudoalteromonas sp. MMG024]|uniref:hypothetical protein n=1 Tax=Pseudoalteromonas sp. MMG024 TaxID=2909980 RepID=UPI001F173C19|nr:hypothetical protein [Pseudoalteromonas sp. MMG024]MCF6455653.1 hypothetical protein [Pseudoalteromonas sp. MMG024]
MTIGNNNVGDVNQTTTQTTTKVDNTPTTVSNNATNNRQVTDVTNQSETQAQQVTSNDNRNTFQKMVDGFCEKFGEFWSKVENSFENSRLYKGMQGFGKGMALTGNAIDYAAGAAREAVQEPVSRGLGIESGVIDACVHRDIRQGNFPSKFSAETSHYILESYPDNLRGMNASYLMKELANETDFAKLFTLHLMSEYSSENIKFLNDVQKNILVDVNQPLNRGSNNLEFGADDVLDLFNKYLGTNASTTVNIGSTTRKAVGHDFHSYVSALKDLELATRAQTDDNAQRLGGQDVARNLQISKSPNVLDGDMAKLKSVDIKLTDEIDQNDPLYTEKQAVLDCKSKLSTSLRASINEIGTLMNDPNLRLRTQLNQNVKGTAYDPSTLTPAPAATVAPAAPAATVTTVASTSSNAAVTSSANIETRISDLANAIDANANQITHSSTFSHSHMTLAHISKVADVIEPTNSLSVDELSVPQNDDQLAVSNESNGNVSNNSIGRTHTYGNTLTVPGMGEN